MQSAHSVVRIVSETGRRMDAHRRRLCGRVFGVCVCVWSPLIREASKCCAATENNITFFNYNTTYIVPSFAFHLSRNASVAHIPLLYLLLFHSLRFALITLARVRPHWLSHRRYLSGSSKIKWVLRLRSHFHFNCLFRLYNFFCFVLFLFFSVFSSSQDKRPALVHDAHT